MQKLFKHIYRINCTNIALWIIFSILMIISLSIPIAKPDYQSSLDLDIAIICTFIIAISVSCLCFILNILQSILILVYFNVVYKHKTFLLVCGILLIFFTLIINCVFDHKLRQIIKENQYEDINIEPYEKIFTNNSNQTYDSNLGTNFDLNKTVLLIDEITKMFYSKEKGIINEKEYINFKNQLITKCGL